MHSYSNPRVYTKVWGRGIFLIVDNGLAALGDDAQAVVFEVPKAVCTALDEFHFPVEALGDAVVLGEAPHAGDGFLPVEQGFGERLEWFEIGVPELADVPVKDFGVYSALFFGLVFSVHESAELVHLGMDGFECGMLFEELVKFLLLVWS